MTAMTPEERLARDLEYVKFCPHMDWQTNACSACRAYRLKVALEEAWAENERLRTLKVGEWMEEWETSDLKGSILDWIDRAERAEQTIREMAADALTREAQYEELERAELARDKWRRQALAEQDNHMAWRARAERAERLMRGKNLSIAAYRAALDRVRALADEMDAAQRSGHTSPTAARIRAAIEGDHQ